MPQTGETDHRNLPLEIDSMLAFVRFHIDRIFQEPNFSNTQKITH